MVDENDAELLRRYAEDGVEAAFAALVQRHLRLVYAAALRRTNGDPHLAADVSQAVFAALAREAASLQRHRLLAGWIYTATRNAALNVLREEKRRRIREQEAHLMQQSETTAGTFPREIDWSRARTVYEAMDELNERERQAVLLRFFEARPFAQVGLVLGVSEDAARMRVERALEKLRGLLARRGVTSTSAAVTALLAQEAVCAVPAGLAATVTSSAVAGVAGAAVAGAPLAGLVQFMATSKLATGLGAAFLVLAIGVTTVEHRARHAAEQALATQAAEGASLEARLRKLKERLATADTKLSAARAAAVNAAPVRAPAVQTDPVKAGEAFLARHPEAQKLWDELRRAQLRSGMSTIYGAVSLSPEQREQFESAMERGTGHSTLLTGPDGSTIQLQRKAAISGSASLAEGRQSLGADTFDRLLARGKLTGGDTYVEQLASLLYRSEPLSASQTDAMLVIFAEATRPGAQGRMPRPHEFDWDGIAAKAAPVLSPAQFASIVRLRRQHEIPVETLTGPPPGGSAGSRAPANRPPAP
jgi:RNA polymerase sigma factor (sigma-70 family)